MACSGLGWSWDDLAKSAGVSRDTVARFLRGEELKEATLSTIEHALVRAGVEFIDEGQSSEGGGPGVRLAKQPRRKRSK